MTSDDDDRASRPDERRRHQRFTASISVDYTTGESFLFAYIDNISEMGIFVRSEDPAPVGTRLRLRFASPDGAEPLELDGEVVWINPVRVIGDNPNPGMGVRFLELTPDQRERVVDLVRTVAYLQSEEN